MSPKRRWYQRLKGRFPKALEVALASDNERQRNFAWLYLDVVGADGTQRAFAEKLGWDPDNGQSRVHQYLYGMKAITDDAVEQMAAALGRPRIDFIRPCHPLGFDMRGPLGSIEPGDEEWDRMWAYHATVRHDGSYEDPKVLREKKPYYFPE